MIRFADQRDIRAEASIIWAALFDLEVLKASIPGCQDMTGSPEMGYEATVTRKIGPVRMRFAVEFGISEVKPVQSLKLSGEGKGGIAGFVGGNARVRLEPLPTGTRIVYEVEAELSGWLTRLGGRTADRLVKRMADVFFNRFRRAVEGPEVPATLK